MHVDEFNKQYDGQLRFVHHHHLSCSPEFHYLAQWCPVSEEWQRVIPHWIKPQAHFDGCEIPAKILEGVGEFLANDCRVSYVLVVKEKHGTHYMDATTMLELGRSCLSLLADRLKKGWYQPRSVPSEPVYTVDQVDADIDLRRQVENQWRQYEHDLKVLKAEQQFVKSVETALKMNLYFSALRLLESRCDYEYEMVVLESMYRPRYDITPQNRETETQT